MKLNFKIVLNVLLFSELSDVYLCEVCLEINI